MQSVLNVIFDSVLLVGGSYIGVGFALGLVDRWHKCHPDAKQASAHALTALPAATTPELAAELDEKQRLEMPELERKREVEAIALDDLSLDR